MTNMMLKTSLLLATIAVTASSSFAQQADTTKRGPRDVTRPTTGVRPTTPGTTTPVTVTPRPQPVVVTPMPQPVVATPTPRPALVVTSPPPIVEQPRLGFGAYTPGIDRRQAEQAREIERGHRNGSLTDREYRDLKAEQTRIAELERRAKADGVVTREERRQIRSAQDAAGRHIIEEETDNERAGGRRRHGGWRGWW